MVYMYIQSSQMDKWSERQCGEFFKDYMFAVHISSDFGMLSYHNMLNNAI